jgi:hypothetical protein
MTSDAPLDELAAAADDYNIRSHYLDVSTELRRSFRHGPHRVGETVPRFSLATLDGEFVDFSELAGGRHIALIFGSYTAPMCTLEFSPFEDLSRSVQGPNSAVLFVYTREIHPDEPVPPRGHIIPPHRSLKEKIACARLFRDEFALTMPIFVDSISGTVHRAFGSLPFQAAVIDRAEVIAFRSEWAEARRLGAVLANLEARDRYTASGSMRNSYSEGLWGVDAGAWH